MSIYYIFEKYVVMGILSYYDQQVYDLLESKNVEITPELKRYLKRMKKEFILTMEETDDAVESFSENIKRIYEKISGAENNDLVEYHTYLFDKNINHYDLSCLFFTIFVVVGALKFVL